MKNYFKILFLSVIGFSTAGISLGSGSKRAVPPAAALTRLLSHYTTYQAHFKQITQDEGGHTLQASQGTVYLKRPGQFRWDIISPSKQAIIANQGTLWVYDVLLSQASLHHLKDARPLDVARLLTESAQTLSTHFKISLKDCGMNRCYHLVPRKKGSVFLYVDLHFSKGSLNAIFVKNNLHQKNAFVFSKIKMNPNLDQALFHFESPKGVDVLKDS